MRPLKVQLLFLLMLLLLVNQASAEMNLSENIEVYKGDLNLKVHLVRVLPLEKNQALMKISGIEHELNNLVLLYDVKTKDSDRRLMTTLYGRDFYPFVESSQWGRKNHTLYLHGVRASQDLYFDEKESAKAKPKDLLKLHKEQQSKGLLAQVQKFNRENELNAIKASVAEMQQEMADECGKNIDISMDWDSITDDIIKEYSVSSYCGNAFDGITRICGDGDSQKSWVQQSVKTVHCGFGEKLRLKLDDTTLKFQTTPEGVNQSDFVKQNLINIM